ncbi:hypothetical protein [Demequina salsinemoris]|uniref:hypothetical protein n=1 Tax=Demequina salsinemoris TaxID=577470 RepID=UPI000780F08B|nr:hypothetical protein [Demequina salsinemoris]
MRLMNEYAVDWPLWDDDDVGPALDGNPAGLPDELTQRILAWAASFNAHFEPEHGWPSRIAANQHAAEATSLLRGLRRARPDIEFTLELWETAVRDGASR